MSTMLCDKMSSPRITIHFVMKCCRSNSWITKARKCAETDQTRRPPTALHYRATQALPHTTTHYHTLPHTTTRYHMLPHATTRYHTLPHATTHYHTLCIRHIKNVISVTFIPSHLPLIQPPKASPMSFLCDEYKSLPMPASTVLMSGYFSLH